MNFLIYPTFGSVNVKVEKTVKILDGIDLNSILLNPIVKYSIDLKTDKECFKKGDDVVILKNDKEHKEDKEHIEQRGKLIELTADYVDVEIDNILHRITEYSSILQKKDEKSENILHVSSPSFLTYLFNKISWSPVYTINLKENEASLVCNANIFVKEIEGDITLISGSYSKKSQKFEECISYPLGNIKIVDSKVIPLFSKEKLEVLKFYTHDVSSCNIVENGYSFEYGSFLPEGNVYVYIDSKYVGIFPLYETQKEDSVELKIGQSREISCYSTIESHSKKEDGKELTLINITTKISNKYDKDVELTVKYFVGETTVNSSSEPYTERINDFLEWDIIVNAFQNYLFETILLIS